MPCHDTTINDGAVPIGPIHPLRQEELFHVFVIMMNRTNILFQEHLLNRAKEAVLVVDQLESEKYLLQATHGARRGVACEHEITWSFTRILIRFSLHDRS